MRSFPKIGQQANRLAERANTAHCILQDVNDQNDLVDDVLRILEEMREELARLATDLRSPSPHDNRL